MFRYCLKGLLTPSFQSEILLPRLLFSGIPLSILKPQTSLSRRVKTCYVQFTGPQNVTYSCLMQADRAASHVDRSERSDATKSVRYKDFLQLKHMKIDFLLGLRYNYISKY